MKRVMPAWTRERGVLIAALLAGLLLGAGPAWTDEDEAPARIAALRAAGDYAAARRECAAHLARVAGDSAASGWMRDDARRRLATLDRILAMRPSDRHRMQVADSLGPASEAAYGDGDYDAAARLCAERRSIQETLLGADDAETWETRLVEAMALEDRGDRESSLPLMESVMTAALRKFGPDHPFTDAAHNNLATFYDARGRFADAERHCRASLRIARLNPGDTRNVATSLNNLADNLHQQGEFRAAIAAHREAAALRRAAGGDDDPELAQSTHNLAVSMIESGDATGAASLLAGAIRTYQGLGEDHSGELAAAFTSLGQALYVTGSYTAAESAYAQGVAIRERRHGAHHPRTHAARVNLAICVRDGGRVGEALDLMRPSVTAIAAAFGDDHPDAIWGLRNLAEAHFIAEDNGVAESLLVRAAEGFERRRLRIAASYRRSRFADSPEPLLAVLRIRRGDARGAWEGFERSLARGLADQIAFQAALAVTPGHAARESDLRLRLLTAEQRIERGLWDAEGVPESLRIEREARLAEWLAFSGSVQAGTPAPSPVTLEALQSVLRDGEVVLGWLEARFANGRDLHYAYVVRSMGEVQWVELPSNPGGASAHILRTALQGRQHVPAAIQSLAAKRVAPVRPLLQGARRIKAIPAGDMLGIPVDLLFAGGADDQPPVPVSYAHSATLLHRSRVAKPRGFPRRPAALICTNPPMSAPPAPEGETAFAGTRSPDATGSRAWSRESVASFRDLPATREEGRAIAAMIGATARVLEGEDCTEQSLVRLARADSLRVFRLLHFAAHGLADDADPERSALVLSQRAPPQEPGDARPYDGLVTAREILAEWRLDADLVTLSVCEGGAGERVPGEGLVGLPQVLLMAGARRMVVALWEVEDRITSLLMRRFYGNLLGSGRPAMEPAAALAEARHWVRQGAGGALEDRYRDQSYLWSAFVMYGD